MHYTLITWWSSWIGHQIAQSILNRSKKDWVIIIDKIPPSIQDSRCIFLKFDLQQIETLNEYLNQKIDPNYSIIALINNAGYQENLSPLEIKLEDIHAMYTIIVYSAVLLSQRFTSRTIKSWLCNGRILNITSIHSEIIRGIPHYSSAKAALKMRSKEFAYALKDHNITVNCIAPGATLTPLLQKDLPTPKLCEEAWLQVPLSRLGTPQEIADLALFLLSPSSSYITWSEFVIDGWLSLVI